MPVLLVLLLLIVVPAAAQSPIPTLLLPEQPVGDPAVRALAGGRLPHIASDGTNFLVASTDSQSFTGGSTSYVTLVDQNANRLLPVSYQFRHGGIDANAASNGRGYLVVWGHAGATFGVRIDGSGALLDSSPITLHGPTRGETGAHDISGSRGVAWNGGEYIVLTAIETVSRNPCCGFYSRLIATRVGASGTVIENDIAVADTAGALIAARNGVALILAGNTARSLVSDVLSTAVPLSRSFDALSDGDDGFLAVAISDAQVVGQHFDTRGQPDAPPFAIADHALGRASVTPAGTAYLVTWTDSSGPTVKAMRVTGRGEPVDQPISVATTQGLWPPVAASNGRAAIVAFSPDEVSTDVAPVRENAPVTRPHRGYAAQVKPQVTWRGNESRVAWIEESARAKLIGDSAATALTQAATLLAAATGPLSTMYVCSTGTRLESFVEGKAPAVLQESTDGMAFYVQEVRVVAVGSDFIVVWSRFSPTPAASALLAARLSSDGALVDGPHVIVPYFVVDLAIGASADSVLVVYNTAGRIMHGVLLTPYGLTATDDITIPQDLAASPSVASDGANFLVTWLSQNYLHSNDYMAGQRIDRQGHLLGSKSIFTTGNDAKAHGAVFWTGSNYLLLWSRGMEFVTPSDLWAVRVSGDGRLVDYPPIQIGALNGRLSSAAIGPGGQLVVAYTRVEQLWLPSRAYTRFVVPARQRSAVHR